MDLKNENEPHYIQEANYAIKNFPKVDIIIPVSHQLKESLLSIIPEIKDKVEVVYNPISVEKIINKSLDNIPEEKYKGLQLLSIGRLSKQKRFDRLIQACRKLKYNDKLDFHLWIVGEGPERTNLTRQIKKLGLENTIELIGFKENPYPYLKASDLFVLSSYHESMAYVILEAMILNKPIVSTNVSGPGELLKASLPKGQLTNKGEYGLITENSTEGVYQGLKKMIQDKNLRDSFINKKPDFSSFEIPRIIKQIETIFDQLTSE